MGAAISGTPKVIEYSHALYKALLELATVETQENGDDVSVFRGKFTDVFQSLSISQAYYSKIRKVLLETGSITIVEQGTRGRPTIMILNHPPPEGAKVPPEPLTARPTFAILDRRVQNLESWRESQGGINIGEALRNMELRLAHLESKRENRRENGKATT